MSAAHDAMETLREPFNAAAHAFSTALEELDGNTDAGFAVAMNRSDAHRALTSAAQILTDLTGIRNVLASACRTAVLPSDLYDAPTRTARFASKDVFARALPVKAGHFSRGSLDWYAAILSIPGTGIAWQTPDEQEAHVAGLPAQSPAYTVAGSR